MKKREQIITEAITVFTYYAKRKLRVHPSSLIFSIIYVIGWIGEDFYTALFERLKSIWNPKGEDLDAATAEYPMDGRMEGLKARVKVLMVVSESFSGSAITLPDGYFVHSDTGNRFYPVNEDESVSITELIEFEAENVGDDYNVDAGEIRNTSASITGIDYVMNPSAAEGGLDRESDERLSERKDKFLDAQCKTTPLAISEFGEKYAFHAECKPFHPSPGSSTLFLCDRAGNIPESTLETVRENMETDDTWGHVPTGSTVYADRPRKILFIPTIDLVKNVGFVEPDFKEAVRNYIRSLGLRAKLVLVDIAKTVQSELEETVSYIPKIAALAVGGCRYLPVAIIAVRGKTDWTKKELEWSYSRTSLRFDGGNEVNVREVTGENVTLYDFNNESAIIITVEPFVTGHRYPLYSMSEEITLEDIPNIKRFDHGDFLTINEVFVNYKGFGGTIEFE